MSFSMHSTIIHIPAIKISKVSIVPDKFSTFPCPYGWFLSGGRLDILTEKKAIQDASKSRNV